MVNKHLKAIFSQSVIYGFGSLIPKFVGFLLIPIYTRVLSPNDYGILALASVTGGILSAIYDLGQKGSISRFYHEYSGVERSKFFGTIWVFKLIFGLLLAVVLTIFGKPLFSIIFVDVPFYPFILIAVWASFFASFSIFPNTILRMEKNAIYFSALSISRFLVSTLLILYFLLVLQRGALGSLQASLIASVIFFTLYLFWLKGRVKMVFITEKLKIALRFGLPLIPHALAAWALTFIDRIMIERMIDLSQVGIYAIGYNAGFMVSLVVGAINLSWTPFFLETVKKQKEKAKIIFPPVITYYFMFITFVALGLALFSKEAVILLTTPQFFEAHKIIPVIAFGYLFQGMYFIASSGLFQQKKTALIATTTTLMAILNIGLNLILIPIYGISGAAWATAISFFVFFIVIYALSQRVFPLKYEWKKITFIFILSVAIYMISTHIPSVSLALNLIYKGLLLVSFVAILRLAGLLKELEIPKLKKRLFNR